MESILNNVTWFNHYLNHLKSIYSMEIVYIIFWIGSPWIGCGDNVPGLGLGRSHGSQAGCWKEAAHRNCAMVYINVYLVGGLNPSEKY